MKDITKDIYTLRDLVEVVYALIEAGYDSGTEIYGYNDTYAEPFVTIYNQVLTDEEVGEDGIRSKICINVST